MSAIRPGFLAALVILLTQGVEAQSQNKLVAAATAQIGVTVRYDPEYRVIGYPGGDVPVDRGVCTDVIVRAYRAIGVDLQKLVNEDMRANFDAYPHKWGLPHADSNIDHRRVPNLAVFFTRHGQKLPVSASAAGYLPGDIVTWKLDSGQDHIGMVSDRKTDGRPLMIHNIGEGTQREDVLFAYKVVGHYRYLP